nr:MAG TPA: hypothetical protein [Caudoviricetes sp.]
MSFGQGGSPAWFSEIRKEGASDSGSARLFVGHVYWPRLSRRHIHWFSACLI